MNLNSITTKITLVFVFTFFLLIAVFMFYLKYEKESTLSEVVASHEKFSQYLFEQKMPPRELINYLESISFKAVENHREVLHNSTIVSRKRSFETILYKKKYYFHVLTPRFRILFEDLTAYQTNTSSYYFFALFLVLLVAIYVWLINSLKPLHELKNQIANFAQGDLNINCASSKKDEIGDVANEFNNAVKEIELLLSSRQLFLRTVMHELKTPLAKGRIVTELLPSDKQRSRLIQIFEKLDFLINDFAKIEQIVSKNYKLNQQNYTLHEIIEGSLNMLMLHNPDEKVEFDIQLNPRLQVDMVLMSMVFKNLIDNAVKYSCEGKVLLKEEDNAILFISKGKPLSKPINEYFKPFHNDAKEKKHGMGLGLYIVKSVLDLHEMRFEYEYKENMNIFKIIYIQK